MDSIFLLFFQKNKDEKKYWELLEMLHSARKGNNFQLAHVDIPGNGLRSTQKKKKQNLMQSVTAAIRLRYIVTNQTTL